MNKPPFECGLPQGYTPPPVKQPSLIPYGMITLYLIAGVAVLWIAVELAMRWVS